MPDQEHQHVGLDHRDCGQAEGVLVRRSVQDQPDPHIPKLNEDPRGQHQRKQCGTVQDQRNHQSGH